MYWSTVTDILSIYGSSSICVWVPENVLSISSIRNNIKLASILPIDGLPCCKARQQVLESRSFDPAIARGIIDEHSKECVTIVEHSHSFSVVLQHAVFSDLAAHHHPIGKHVDDSQDNGGNHHD